MSLNVSSSLWAIGFGITLFACASPVDAADTAESDPGNVAASQQTRDQLGVSRWDIHDAPNAIKGYDAEENAIVFLQHERVDQGAKVLHRFGLREHANQAVTQLLLPKDASSEGLREILAHQVSAGFDPKNVLSRMLSDFQPNRAASSLSASSFGADSLRPLDEVGTPIAQCATMSREDALTADCPPELIRRPKPEPTSEDRARAIIAAGKVVQESFDCLGSPNTCTPSN